MTSDTLHRCRDAVAKLDHVLRSHPAEIAQELTDAVRCVVMLRDNMIERRDRGGRSPERDRRLGQVNAVISAIVAGEFPLMGVRWQRIEGARDLLRRILAEEEEEAAAF
jgi:hypothetical protein